MGSERAAGRVRARGRRLLGSAFGALLVALVMAPPARADEPSTQGASLREPSSRARLEVVRDAATAGCASQSDLERAVAERLGRDPFDEHAAAVVRVAISMRGAERVAAVRRFDAEGKEIGAREIASAGEGCAELSAAIALALSIAMDPAGAAGPPPPRKAPVVAAPPPPPVAHMAPPAAIATPPPAEPLHVQVGVDVHAALGSAPASAIGFGGHVEGRLGRFELDVEGRGDLPAGTALVPAGQVKSSLVLGRVAPCVHLAFAYGCALGSMGALSGTTAGVEGGRDRTTLFAGAGARLGLELPLFSRFVIRPHADVEATLVKTTLDFAGQPAWVTPPVYGALALELSARLR